MFHHSFTSAGQAGVIKKRHRKQYRYVVPVLGGRVPFGTVRFVLFVACRSPVRFRLQARAYASAKPTAKRNSITAVAWQCYGSSMAAV
jgi:hypothetical protein